MLSFISAVYVLLAFLTGIGALLGVVVALPNAVNFYPHYGLASWTTVIYCIVGGSLSVITLLAISEAIKVFLSIEEHTRKAAEIARGSRTVP